MRRSRTIDDDHDDSDDPGDRDDGEDGVDYEYHELKAGERTTRVFNPVLPLSYVSACCWPAQRAAMAKHMVALLVDTL